MRWKKTFVSSTILLTTVAAVGTAPASATGHTHVVHPGESIQKAVDASSRGDTVAVRAGTYHESVAIQTSGLTLRAVGRVTIRPPRDGKGRCNSPDEAIGICVVPKDIDSNGEYTHRVRAVTVSGFRVVGFNGDGVFGYGSRDLRVSSVRAKQNTGYGVASFDGIGSTFMHNAVSGSKEAGLYVGDSPTAHALVIRNRTWNNQFGVLVRHTHGVAVIGNHVAHNCLGVFLLDDGEKGGSAHNAVLGNHVRRNNHRCAVEEIPNTPVIGGGGIVAAGSKSNLIAGNVVRGNRGDNLFSGGIVLVTTPAPSTDGSFSAATGNLVARNRASRNRPADIVEDKASSPNRFVDNRCRTSIPGGLCGPGTHHG